MKIVVALDKFKGSLTASSACDVVRRSLLAVQPEAQVFVKPMADGGEGTAEVLRAAIGGKWISRNVTGPLPATSDTTSRFHQKVRGRARPPGALYPGNQAYSNTDRARYLWVAERQLAVIEMAAASGLTLLAATQRNPMRTTTYGTGELIADAVARGAKRILLGVGGSATVDGGVGAAVALGWKFLDVNGKEVGFGGGELERIACIVPPPHRRWPKMEVLCDVDNPLCGSHGAARVFGPQKGATPIMVRRLDVGLRHLARLIKTQLGKDVRDIPGGGAAGGLAAGAMAFFGAHLAPGAERVMAASGLTKALRGADEVITGEGCFDEQSLRGKVVSGVVKQARALRVPVVVLAGAVRLREAQWRRAGVAEVIAIQPPGMSTAESMKRAKELLWNAVKKWGRAQLLSSP